METEVVDTDGNVGKFSSLKLDSLGRPHIAYFEWTDRVSGVDQGLVKYAAWSGEVWEIEEVAQLDEVKIAFIGARRLVTLVLDSADQPHLAFCTRQEVTYATKSDGQWEHHLVGEPMSGDYHLGQLASLALGFDDRPHIAYFQLPAESSSSTGLVYYALGPKPMPTAVEFTEAAESTGLPVPDRHQLFRNYPNPFNPSTAIEFFLPNSALVELAVYDLTGRRIRTLLNAPHQVGSYAIKWDGRDDQGNDAASGVYLARLHSGEFVGVRKMLLVK